MIPGKSKLKNSGEALEVGQANSSFTSVRAGDVSNRSLSLLAPWELKVKLNFNFNFRKEKMNEILLCNTGRIGFLMLLLQ